MPRVGKCSGLMISNSYVSNFNRQILANDGGIHGDSVFDSCSCEFGAEEGKGDPMPDFRQLRSHY